MKWWLPLYYLESLSRLALLSSETAFLLLFSLFWWGEFWFITFPMLKILLSIISIFFFTWADWHEEIVKIHSPYSQWRRPYQTQKIHWRFRTRRIKDDEFRTLFNLNGEHWSLFYKTITRTHSPVKTLTLFGCLMEGKCKFL